MKKFLLSSVVFSLVFIFASVSLAQVQEQIKPKPNQQINQVNKPQIKKQNNQIKSNLEATSSLEKISNPGQIGLFQKIQKIGASLFGIKIQQNSQKPIQPNSGQPNNQIQPQVQSDTTSSASTTLEKISSPVEISLFDKVKKVGTALWGIRINKNNEEKPVSSQPKYVYITPAAAQCVKDAIDKKDASLKTSQINHARDISLLIDARGACQKTALDQITDKTQADANKLCVGTFQKGVNDLNKVIDVSKKDAFEIYKIDLRSCSNLQINSTGTTTPTIVMSIMVPDEIEQPIEQSTK